MIYVADLGHDHLLKVGITDRFYRPTARPAELRGELREPLLEVFLSAYVPFGWGTDREWETRLLRNIAQRSGRLQILAKAHRSTEVVEATREDAAEALRLMLRESEVDPCKHAWELDPHREDWRFQAFIERQYHKARWSPGSEWSDPLLRQTFLYWLRKEPFARWERETRGLSCWEIDAIFRIPCGVEPQCGAQSADG
jgi:hypothetical protein